MMTISGTIFLELGGEVGIGALADGGGDVLHALGALVGGLDLLHEHQRVEQSDDRDGEHGHQGVHAPASYISDR
jgi:hypothetical protein